jgi:Flp pilus assembly protein TadD
LTETVEGYLKQAYPDRAARAGAAGFEVRPADYEEYLRLRREIDSRKEGWTDDQILARIRALHQGSPRFLEAYTLEAELLRFRFGARRDGGDLEAAFAALGRAREIAPDDPRPLFAQFELGLRGDRLEWSEEALAVLERLQPGDPSVGMQRARLLERRGESRDALALMRTAARQRPSINHLSRLADMEYRLGESEQARLHAREILSRFPDYRSAKSLLAQVELNYGDPAKAAALYRELVAHAPLWGELVNLGLAEMLLARYAEAERALVEARRLAPANPYGALNLADVMTLQGKKEAADRLYRELLAMIERDPAAGDWQLVSLKAQAYAHLGDRARAVEGAQQVLLLARDNPQASQEVAQVYVLVGDEASALVNAKLALRLGVEPRWFSFPWFDPLRRSADFRSVIAEAERRRAPS